MSQEIRDLASRSEKITEALWAFVFRTEKLIRAYDERILHLRREVEYWRRQASEAQSKNGGK